MARWSLPILIGVCFAVSATPAIAQTTTYHMHAEASSTSGLSQLKIGGPEPGIVAIQSADLKNHGAEDAFLKSFDTQAGVPGLGGIIPANSTLTFTVWIKKTASFGTVFPRVSAGLNWPSGTSLCSPTNGGTAISTTQASYTVSCTTGASAITMTATDRIWVSIGYHMTTGPGAHTMKVELDLEGTASGATDSRVDVPNALGPTISSLSVTSGPINWPVTISGTNFGASQGTGIVQFNGTTAAITSWTMTSIQTQVPAGATTGPVIVTTSTGRVSNGLTFTLVPPPTLTSVAPVIGRIGDSVTISGTNFMSSQGSSTVTFNGTAGSPTGWNNTTITVPVPSGSTSGSVVVTVSGQSTSTLPFTVIGVPSVTSAAPSGARVGASVTVAGANFGASQGASTIKFNGTTATPSYWSDTAIAVPVPTGATTGNVVVTVSAQASNGLPFTVTVPGTIAGTVTRVTGGTAISGATVQALLAGVVKGTATTIANGTYSIPSLDPGTYEVWLSATSFSNEVRQSIAVTASTTTTVNVAMSTPGSVSGTITQANGVTPISGAAVTLLTGSVEKGSTNTNTSGAYSIAGLRPGAYTVRAANAGYRAKETAATVVENANATVNASLDALAAGTVAYVYDELGRLVQVTDQAGDAAIYRYDAVGNITSITRTGATTVSISEFTPNAGTIGSTVTILGTGFSATPSQNTVAFSCGSSCVVNGTITSASAAQLVTTVPATATTGAIGVTSPNGAATSSTSFTVSTNSGAPTISGFTPTIGVAGSQISVSGANFETAPTNDRTKVNISLAGVTAATSTALTVTVPTATASGPIAVVTPAGSAVSATDFYIPPLAYVASDVVYTARITMGGTLTPAINTANKIGLLTFTGTAGQRIFLNGTNGMTGQIFGCDVSVSIFRPDAGTLVPPTCMEQSGFVDVTTLPTTGTYTILVDPEGAATGSVTLALYSVTDISGTITVGGSSVPVSISTPGQNAALTFSGTAGQRVSLFGTGTISGQVFLTCDVDVRILRVSDNLNVGSTCMEGSGFIDTVTLPTTDSYKVVIDPYAYSIGDLTLTLYNITDVSGTITADGSTTTMSITTPGQNGALTFSGTAGQRISLEGTNGTIAGQVFLTCDVNVSIVRVSDSSTVAGPSCMEVSGFIETFALPSTGTYKVVVDPTYVATGNLPLNLYTVPADLSGTLTINATATPVSLPTPGQNASYTVTVGSSQAVTVHVTNNTVAGAAPCVTVSLMNGGSTVTSSASCGASFDLAQQTLAAGTYTVVIDPSANSKGSLSVQVTTP